MAVWARLSSLLSANINVLLDRAEDPERMLAHVIRDMEEGLAAARGQAATAIAAARRLGRELGQCRAAASHCKEQARLACSCGREDLARQALARKIEQDDLVQALATQFAAAQQSSLEVKTALRVLQTRLAEARRKQSMLLARQRVATVRLAAQRVLADAPASFDRFSRFEDRLVDIEDLLLAQLEVAQPAEDELLNLEAKKRIEDELDALRRESGTAGL